MPVSQWDIEQIESATLREMAEEERQKRLAGKIGPEPPPPSSRPTMKEQAEMAKPFELSTGQKILRGVLHSFPGGLMATHALGLEPTPAQISKEIRKYAEKPPDEVEARKKSALPRARKLVQMASGAPPLMAATVVEDPKAAKDISLGLAAGLSETAQEFGHPLTMAILLPIYGLSKLKAGLALANRKRAAKLAALAEAAISGKFSVDMLTKLVADEIPEVADALRRGDYFSAGESLSRGVISGIFGVGMAKHARRSFKEAWKGVPRPPGKELAEERIAGAKQEARGEKAKPEEGPRPSDFRPEDIPDEAYEGFVKPFGVSKEQFAQDLSGKTRAQIFEQINKFRQDANRLERMESELAELNRIAEEAPQTIAELRRKALQEEYGVGGTEKKAQRAKQALAEAEARLKKTLERRNALQEEIRTLRQENPSGRAEALRNVMAELERRMAESLQEEAPGPPPRETAGPSGAEPPPRPKWDEPQAPRPEPESPRYGERALRPAPEGEQAVPGPPPALPPAEQSILAGRRGVRLGPKETLEQRGLLVTAELVEQARRLVSGRDEPITTRDLADALGIPSEPAASIIARLEADGLIAPENPNITVVSGGRVTQEFLRRHLDEPFKKRQSLTRAIEAYRQGPAGAAEISGFVRRSDGGVMEPRPDTTGYRRPLSQRKPAPPSRSPQTRRPRRLPEDTTPPTEAAPQVPEPTPPAPQKPPAPPVSQEAKTPPPTPAEKAVPRKKPIRSATKKLQVGPPADYETAPAGKVEPSASRYWELASELDRVREHPMYNSKSAQGEILRRRAEALEREMKFHGPAALKEQQQKTVEAIGKQRAKEDATKAKEAEGIFALSKLAKPGGGLKAKFAPGVKVRNVALNEIYEITDLRRSAKGSRTFIVHLKGKKDPVRIPGNTEVEIIREPPERPPAPPPEKAKAAEEEEASEGQVPPRVKELAERADALLEEVQQLVSDPEFTKRTAEGTRMRQRAELLKREAESYMEEARSILTEELRKGGGSPPEGGSRFAAYRQGNFWISAKGKQIPVMAHETHLEAAKRAIPEAKRARKNAERAALRNKYVRVSGGIGLEANIKAVGTEGFRKALESVAKSAERVVYVDIYKGDQMIFLALEKEAAAYLSKKKPAELAKSLRPLIDDAARRQERGGQVKFSIRQKEARGETSGPLEIETEITLSTVEAAFPGAKVQEFGSGDFMVTLPNGKRIFVLRDSTIVVNPEAYQAGAGKPFDPSRQVVGLFQPIKAGALIRLAKVKGAKGVLDHEAFHAAMELALTPKERRALLEQFGDEEAAAEAFRMWREEQTKTGLFEKIRNFFRRIVAWLFRKPEAIFADIAKGKVFSREAPPEPDAGRTPGALRFMERKGKGKGKEKGQRPVPKRTKGGFAVVPPEKRRLPIPPDTYQTVPPPPPAPKEPGVIPSPFRAPREETVARQELLAPKEPQRRGPLPGASILEPPKTEGLTGVEPRSLTVLPLPEGASKLPTAEDLGFPSKLAETTMSLKATVSKMGAEEPTGWFVAEMVPREKLEALPQVLRAETDLAQPAAEGFDAVRSGVSRELETIAGQAMFSEPVVLLFDGRRVALDETGPYKILAAKQLDIENIPVRIRHVPEESISRQDSRPVFPRTLPNRVNRFSDVGFEPALDASSVEIHVPSSTMAEMRDALYEAIKPNDLVKGGIKPQSAATMESGLLADSVEEVKDTYSQYGPIQLSFKPVRVVPATKEVRYDSLRVPVEVSVEDGPRITTTEIEVARVKPRRGRKYSGLQLLINPEATVKTLFFRERGDVSRAIRLTGAPGAVPRDLEFPEVQSAEDPLEPDTPDEVITAPEPNLPVAAIVEFRPGEKLVAVSKRSGFPPGTVVEFLGEAEGKAAALFRFRTEGGTTKEIAMSPWQVRENFRRLSEGESPEDVIVRPVRKPAVKTAARTAGAFKPGEKVILAGKAGDLPKGTVATLISYEGDGSVSLRTPDGTEVVLKPADAAKLRRYQHPTPVAPSQAEIIKLRNTEVGLPGWSVRVSDTFVESHVASVEETYNDAKRVAARLRSEEVKEIRSRAGLRHYYARPTGKGEWAVAFDDPRTRLPVNVTKHATKAIASREAKKMNDQVLDVVHKKFGHEGYKPVKLPDGRWAVVRDDPVITENHLLKEILVTPRAKFSPERYLVQEQATAIRPRDSEWLDSPAGEAVDDIFEWAYDSRAYPIRIQILAEDGQTILKEFNVKSHADALFVSGSVAKGIMATLGKAASVRAFPISGSGLPLNRKLADIKAQARKSDITSASQESKKKKEISPRRRRKQKGAAKLELAGMGLPLLVEKGVALWRRLAHRAQVIFDPARKPDTIPVNYGLRVERAWTKEGKLKIGVNVERMARVLAQSHYEGPPGIVTAREALQNAIDAVRPLGKDGRVIVDIVDGELLVIADNGPGMSREELGSIFTDLMERGESGGQTGTTGGFGIGKAAVLLNGEEVTVATATKKDAEPGSRMVHHFNTTPEDLIQGRVEVTSTKIPEKGAPAVAEFETGTMVQIRLTPSEIGYAQGFLEKAIASLNIPATVAFSIDGIPFQGRDSIKPQNMKKLSTETVRGAEIDFYVSKEPAGSNLSEISYRVLNNGLLQYSWYTSLPSPAGGLPSLVVVDVRPTVTEESPDYPFSANRDRLKSEIMNFVDEKIRRDIGDPAMDLYGSYLRNTYEEMPTVKTEAGEVIIFDPGQRLTEEHIETIRAFPEIVKIMGTIARVGQQLQSAARQRMSSLRREETPEIERWGIAISKDFAGLFMESEHLNIPPTAFVELGEAFRYTNGGAKETASVIHHILIHEITHAKVRGHNASFSQAMTSNYAIPREIINSTLKEIEDVISSRSDPTKPNGAFEILSALSDYEARTTDRHPLMDFAEEIGPSPDRARLPGERPGSGGIVRRGEALGPEGVQREPQPPREEGAAEGKGRRRGQAPISSRRKRRQRGSVSLDLLLPGIERFIDWVSKKKNKKKVKEVERVAQMGIFDSIKRRAGKEAPEELQVPEYVKEESMKSGELVPSSFERRAGGEEWEHELVGMDADPQRLSMILGPNLYKNRGGFAIIREAMQNAIDAVRDAGANAEIMVDIVGDLASDKGAISVADHGPGMSREEIKNVFLKLGAEGGKGSLKGTTGGFGIGKSAILLGGKQFNFVSITRKDAPEGYIAIHSMSATPEEISGKRALLKSKVVRDEGRQATGFFVSVETDYGGASDARRFVNAAIHSWNTDVALVMRGEKGETTRVKPRKIEEFKDLGSFQGPGFVARMYADPRPPSMPFMGIMYMNNGLLQISDSKLINRDFIDEFPDTVFIDISPNVPETSPQYPFTANRESLHREARAAVDKEIKQRIFDPIDMSIKKHVIEAYRNMPVFAVPSGMAWIYDADGTLTREEIEEIGRDKDVLLLLDAINRIGRSMYEKMIAAGAPIPSEQRKPTRFGLMFSSKSAGRNLLNPVNEEETGVFISIKPFGLSDPRRLAGLASHVLFHEMTHNFERTEGQSLNIAMAMSYSLPVEFQVEMLEAFENVYKDPNTGQLREGIKRADEIFKRGAGRKGRDILAKLAARLADSLGGAEGTTESTRSEPGVRESGARTGLEAEEGAAGGGRGRQTDAEGIPPPPPPERNRERGAIALDLLLPGVEKIIGWIKKIKNGGAAAKPKERIDLEKVAYDALLTGLPPRGIYARLFGWREPAKGTAGPQFGLEETRFAQALAVDIVAESMQGAYERALADGLSHEQAMAEAGVAASEKVNELLNAKAGEFERMLYERAVPYLEKALGRSIPAKKLEKGRKAFEKAAERYAPLRMDMAYSYWRAATGAFPVMTVHGPIGYLELKPGQVFMSEDGSKLIKIKRLSKNGWINLTMVRSAEAGGGQSERQVMPDRLLEILLEEKMTPAKDKADRAVAKKSTGEKQVARTRSISPGTVYRLTDIEEGTEFLVKIDSAARGRVEVLLLDAERGSPERLVMTEKEFKEMLRDGRARKATTAEWEGAANGEGPIGSGVAMLPPPPPPAAGGGGLFYA